MGGGREPLRARRRQRERSRNRARPGPAAVPKSRDRWQPTRGASRGRQAWRQRISSGPDRSTRGAAGLRAGWLALLQSGQRQMRRPGKRARRRTQGDCSQRLEDGREPQSSSDPARGYRACSQITTRRNSPSAGASWPYTLKVRLSGDMFRVHCGKEGAGPCGGNARKGNNNSTGAPTRRLRRGSSSSPGPSSPAARSRPADCWSPVGPGWEPPHRRRPRMPRSSTSRSCSSTSRPASTRTPSPRASSAETCSTSPPRSATTNALTSPFSRERLGTVPAGSRSSTSVRPPPTRRASRQPRSRSRRRWSPPITARPGT